MADGTCGPGSAVPAKRPRLDFPDETSSQQYDGDFQCFAGTSELLSGRCEWRRGISEIDVRGSILAGRPLREAKMAAARALLDACFYGLGRSAAPRDPGSTFSCACLPSWLYGTLI